jgi:hypothetical protein
LGEDGQVISDTQEKNYNPTIDPLEDTASASNFMQWAIHIKLFLARMKRVEAED